MFGCHLPISPDVFDNASQIGANVIQIMNGRNAYKILKASRERNPSIGLFIHATYPINITKTLQPWHIPQMCTDLNFCDSLNGTGVVIHPGSGEFKPKEIASNLMKIATVTQHYKSKIIIEGQASCGQLIVTRVNHMVALWQELLSLNASFTKERFAFCLDTCHLCVGKSPIERNDLYKEFKQFEKEIGSQHLALIHFNDAKVLTADRHEDLFLGYIGNRRLGGNPLNLISVAAWAVDNKVPLVIERHKNSLKNLSLQISTMREILHYGPSALDNLLLKYYDNIKSI